jgi:hypothetical protein
MMIAANACVMRAVGGMLFALGKEYETVIVPSKAAVYA